MAAPVSLMMLVKDDRHALETIRQARPHVAEVVVGYTACEALTTRELEDAGARVVPVPGPLKDWAWARNRVLAECRASYLSWADSDDDVEGLERLDEAIRVLEIHPFGRYFAPYEYDFDPKTGACSKMQYRERLVRNDGRFEWRYPCHEVLVAKDGNYGGKEPRGTFPVWKHRREEQPESLGQQEEMLRAYEAAHPDDPWLHRMLGTTLLLLRRPQEAIPYLERNVGTSGWDDDRVMAMIELSRAEQQAGGFGRDDARAMAWLEKARDLRPGWFEPHFEIGKLWYLRGALLGAEGAMERAAESYERARAAEEADHPLTTSPADRGFYVHDFEMQARAEMQDWAGARACAERALESRPDDAKMRAAKRRFEAVLRMEEAERVQEEAAARLQPEGKYVHSQAGEKIFSGPRNPTGLDVVFACGQSWVPWNPAIVDEEGFGGSETMVVEMARRLKASGAARRVRVYCTSEGSGIYDGVEYVDSSTLREGDRVDCDVLVAWRMAPLLDFADARAKFLWVHDVIAINATPELMLKADRVLALSEWHAKNLIKVHDLAPERVHTTRNAIDLARFAGSEERDSHRAIYSSSADRGLAILLYVWPAIRARVPDATLRVFYGMDDYKRDAQQSGQEMRKYLVWSLERLLEMPGVEYVGKVSGQKLAREMMAAGVWTTPHWFTETFCIGAAEAQAAGCRVVTTPVAALRETVGTSGVLVDGYWLDAKFQRRYVDEVVRAMTAEEGRWVKTREEIAAGARERFGFDSLVADWAKLFASVIEETESGEILPYRGIL